jgi:hypothetical protein
MVTRTRQRSVPVAVVALGLGAAWAVVSWAGKHAESEPAPTPSTVAVHDSNPRHAHLFATWRKYPHNDTSSVRITYWVNGQPRTETDPPYRRIDEDYVQWYRLIPDYDGGLITVTVMSGGVVSCDIIVPDQKPVSNNSEGSVTCELPASR